MWPAHWMTSDRECWPVGAEIDVMESISNPKSQMYPKKDKNNKNNNNIKKKKKTKNIFN